MYKVTVSIQEYLQQKETIMPSIADVCEHIQEALLEVSDQGLHWSVTVTETPITYREKK